MKCSIVFSNSNCCLMKKSLTFIFNLWSFQDLLLNILLGVSPSWKRLMFFQFKTLSQNRGQGGCTPLISKPRHSVSWQLVKEAWAHLVSPQPPRVMANRFGNRLQLILWGLLKGSRAFSTGNTDGKSFGRLHVWESETSQSWKVVTATGN